ncbi:MAG: antibiotic biosynthesis monooxygenase [Solirubrobacterales bacterium]|nr:antibiotic biosynthesis monooxygenase [Solirubrobacterales bacterium]
MFARVQTLHQPVEQLDELTKAAREQLPSARELSGFSGFYYLTDRNNEKAMVISFWETEEDLRQLEANNAAVRKHVEAEVGITSPPTEIFHVSLHAS